MLQTKFQVSTIQEPGFLKSKFGQNQPLTRFCMYIGPASDFFSLLGFDFRVM